MFESSEQAIQREISEELRMQPSIERLLWITECMFNMSSWGNVYEVCLYYLIRFPADSDIYKKQAFAMEEFDGGSKKITSFRWFSVDEIAMLDFKPKFLKTKFQALSSSSEHFVINELGKI